MSTIQKLDNVKYLTAGEFYNFLHNQYSKRNTIILDIRSKKDYDISHIISSISIHDIQSINNINEIIIIYDKDTFQNIKHIMNEMENKKVYLLNDYYTKIVDIYPDIITSNIEYPSLILNYLYLGNYIDALNYDKLKYMGITAIVNCSKELEDGGDFKYLRLDMYDSTDQHIPLEYFNSVFNLIENEKNRGGKVLIHCYAGISRSSTFVIGYIMWKYKVPYNTAYLYVQSIRDIVKPNDGFKNILLKYENTFLSR